MGSEGAGQGAEQKEGRSLVKKRHTNLLEKIAEVSALRNVLDCFLRYTKFTIKHRFM